MQEDRQPPIDCWDSRREESTFLELEEQFSRELCSDSSFPSIATGFAKRFGELVAQIPLGYSTGLLVDLICSVNCLCLRAWRDYVKAASDSSNGDTLRDMVYRLPNLEDYLASVNLRPSIVKRFPTLAKEDLVARNAYADGGREADYFTKYGLRIPSPEPSLIIAAGIEGNDFREFLGSIFIEDKRLANEYKRFHLLQRFSIGRQRTHENPPFDVDYGVGQHRMIIAGKEEARMASREQLELVVLTPHMLYLRNMGKRKLEIHALRGSSRILDIGENCLVAPDIRIVCSKVQLHIASTQMGGN